MEVLTRSKGPVPSVGNTAVGFCWCEYEETFRKNKPSNSSKPAAKDSKPAEGTKGKDKDKLYNRSSFRKSSRAKAESEAPKNESGKMICPTCGRDIPDSITINTKRTYK